MAKKRIYLSGPITGIGIDKARECFNREAAVLRGSGLEVINPFENGVDEAAPYEEHMLADMELLKTCDVIAMLPGWEESPGARREKEFAESKKMNVVLIRR